MDIVYESPGAKVVLKQNIFNKSHIINEVYLETNADENLLYELIQEAEDKEIQSGRKRLYAKFVKPIDEMMFCHEIMLNAGYTPILLNGHNIEYDLRNINTEKLLELQKKLGTYYKNVATHKELERKQLGKFYEKLKKIKRMPKQYSRSYEYCRYYKGKEGITGVLMSHMTPEGYYICTDSVVISKEDLGYAYTGMIVSLFLELKSKEAEKITFISTDESLYNGLIDVFKVPERDRLVFEYVKKL